MHIYIYILSKKKKHNHKNQYKYNYNSFQKNKETSNFYLKNLLQSLSYINS